MRIGINCLVTLHHYSTKLAFTGKVIESSNDSITLKLINCDTLNSFFKNDPIVAYYSLDDRVYIGNSTILNFDEQERTLFLHVESFDYLKEKRLSERFPLSLLANIRIGQSITDHPSILKNISFNGIMILSESDFPIYQKLKLTFDIGQLIELQTIVIRKEKISQTHYEYGLKIIYIDESTPKMVRNYLISLKNYK